MTTIPKVSLRPVQQCDLPRLYEMQLDHESNQMAVTVARSKEAFDLHWAKILSDPSLDTKAILFGDCLVGHACCFPMDGQHHVGYWVDRTHWGKGIASQALALLLSEVVKRPLFATVATSNVASMRVLQKCGFVVEQIQLAPARDRYPACEEALLVLR